MVGAPLRPWSAAAGWPAVWRRTSSGDAALPWVSCVMTEVGGCWPDVCGADRALPAGPAVGPAPASLAARVLVRPSISVVHGPDIAELVPRANSAALARTNGWIFIAFSFWKLTATTEAVCSSAAVSSTLATARRSVETQMQH